MTLITSPQNERIKLIRALQTQAKARHKERKIVLEGVRLIGDALAAGFTPHYVIYTAESVATGKSGAELMYALSSEGVQCYEAMPAVMEYAAETQNTQGLIAVLPLPELPIPRTLTLALILDGIADPGNMGTILRTAAAAGVDVVILAPGCVDPYNAKVLRSGMGAHFRIPVVLVDWPAIESMCAELHVYLADAAGAQNHDEVDWRNPSALIIGGEAHGADTAAYQMTHSVISIPMANAAESLNAGMAAAVILFEAARQRR